MGYMNIILTAIFAFPILAFFITLPYIIYNYNKFGSVLLIRSILIYAFILYLLCAYFLIIMPLPSIEYVSKIHTKVQLIPFDLLSNIKRTVCFDYKDIHTYFNIFKNPFVYQTIYNFLLMVPFGIFLRYYFKCRIIKTFTISLLLSLFFELTQLTGLYFIYPNAYRLFDVDDLIVNTLGGVFGYLITPIFNILLPTKDELDSKAYKKGIKVSSTRRIITFLIDFVLIVILFIILMTIDHIARLTYSYNIYALVSIFIIYNIIPFITNGKTIGYFITNLSIKKLDGSNTKRYQILFRNIIFSYLYIPLYYYLYIIFVYINKVSKNNYSSIVIVGYITCTFIISILVSVRNLILHKPFMYEKITKTKVVSTIYIEEEKKD